MTHAPQPQAILVVEDESLLRMVAVEAFEAEGYHVLEASSGEKALNLLRDNPPFTGLFTDIDLAGKVDGLMLAKVVHEEYPGTAIMIVSGCQVPTASEIPPLARFLDKPYDFKRVLKSLDEILDEIAAKGERQA